MSVRLVVARGSRPSGRILEELLVAKGLPVAPDGTGTVSYGVRLGAGAHVLNGMAGGRSKFDELRELHRNGVRVPRFFPSHEMLDFRGPGEFLARHAYHKGGTDIVLCGTPASVRYWASRREFFTEMIPSRTEFRVWVYRNAHLGTYEKVLVRPQVKARAEARGRGRGFGRNHHNGYSFQLVQAANVPRGAVELAKQAVKALELDFGAVDILHGEDGQFYVLEVNTAPGVESGRRQCMNSLAEHIVRWARDGFQGRRNAQ